MCPQQKQPEAPTMTSNQSLATSGYYPVPEKPDSVFIESTGPKYPSSVETTPIEIRVLQQTREASPVYEVWTERTVYEFDQGMRCTATRDPHTGEAKDHHECVGARLIGGRRLGNQLVEISSPTPALGHHALLGGDERTTIVTTPVTRVIMNVWRWSSSCKAQGT